MGLDQINSFCTAKETIKRRSTEFEEWFKCAQSSTLAQPKKIKEG
jgi:hypothetical protein